MGSQSRPSIKSGTSSSDKAGVGLQSSEIKDAKSALKTKTSSEAGAIIASYLIKGTGIDLIIAVLHTTIYVIEKLKHYDDLVNKYGEDEAQKRMAVEIGVDLAKKVISDVIVPYAASQIIKDDELPPYIKERTQEITEDILNLGIEKIEQQFLEE